MATRLAPSFPYNGVIARPRMPALLANDVNDDFHSDRFTIPRGAQTLTIHLTDATGDNWTLETLSPDIDPPVDDSEVPVETWATIVRREVIQDTDATGMTLGTFTQTWIDLVLVNGAVFILGSECFGSGILRLVSDISHAGISEPYKIPVVFGF